MVAGSASPDTSWLVAGMRRAPAHGPAVDLDYELPKFPVRGQSAAATICRTRSG